ncbi:hypothetical protein DRW07_04320 [Alteromonas sediminis]|uniref:Solute-binding protein family 3/N-terminal domain-containing protein n=1 Tax=Alteromonas sediminis TaxID=2259342 RepID=A0A3N5Y5V2_9ALTE|nr:hypothetical protein [Alteromonas sediminis]RPJ68633.1 hypothetical protein DRW07_04320 [Alteromonas sediminis]
MRWYNTLIVSIVSAIFSLQSYAANPTASVLAVEYPPFTTNSEINEGIAFAVLRDRTRQSSINWVAEFVPPARAHKRIQQGDWCASFYPAFGDNKYTSLALTSDPIKIGLIRKTQRIPFSWADLEAFSGNSIALLRSGQDSVFVKQFEDAGMQVIFVENIDAAAKMVLLDRADFAMMDNVTYANLDKDIATQLQFSKNILISTPITLFVHVSCYRVLKQAFPQLGR